jgi:multidrug efflux pump subunit AcrA (membrane-fusion protein)
MDRRRGRGTAWVISLAGAWVLCGALLGRAAPADVTNEGLISGVGGGGMAIAVSGGGVAPVKISAATFISRREKVTLEAIKPGDLVGVDAKRTSDGMLVAVAIHIFAPERKGRVREGQFPMNSGDTMTNAEVMEHAVKVEGRTLFLKYKDGAAAIEVPPTTDVDRERVLRLSDLRPGMRVVVRGSANPDGSIAASSILVSQP